MITKNRCFRIMDQILRKVRHKQAEVILSYQDQALTRFADNQVTQNVASHALELSLRIQENGRVGRASTRKTDPVALDDMIRRACEGLSKGSQGGALMPIVKKQRYAPLLIRKGPTHLSTPEGREAALKDIVGCARRSGLEATGIVSYDDGLLALSNTRGVRCAHRIVSGRVSVTMTGRGGEGWADQSGADISPFEIRALARSAAQKCLASRRPKTLQPGPYTVILEPACVADLLQFMAWYGFGAQGYQEGTSFLSGRMGKRLFSKSISIEDNVYHPQTLGFPFDFEGMPRQRVGLIDAGVTRGMVHDRRTARKGRTRTTGHGLPEPNDMGPIPLNLVMCPGRASVEEMIAKTHRGLVVTHFHYTNIMDLNRLILTGLTHDGVFWVENGKVRHPVRNFRFTESLLKAFSQVEAVGREQVYAEGFFGGGFVVPALKIRDFQFTSLAEANT